MTKKNRLSDNTKSKITLTLCIIGFILLQIAVIVCSIKGHSQFNGVLMAFQFGLCLIMCNTDYKIGFRVSIILNVIATTFLLRNVIMTHDLAPIAGFFNTLIYIACFIILVNQFKKREREAITDMLTGQLNRRGLYKVLKAKTASKRPFHLIYVDIDNFKMINDNYGHSYGDLLLKEMSLRLDEIVGRNGIVTRMGGDEFVIVLNGDQDKEEVANDILLRVSDCISLTVGESTMETYLRAYAGIASFPVDSENAEDLLKYADIAMYESTKANAICAYIFDRNMESAVKKQVELEMVIKESLSNDYFYLMYQPQFALTDKKLRGFEALLRIKLPTGTVISPADFIPVAEKSDLIISIDKYVVSKAVNELKSLLSNLDKDIVISINVSAQSITRADFADYIIQKVSEAGIGYGHIEIEITEYCLVQSVETVIDNIKKLKANGIMVALDDFGTGYTSLSYLFKMPIDLLKIDKSLIDDIGKNEKNRKFVNTVISLGHLMGCEVISEGVETEEQLALLNDQKCDFIQGFVWGRPMNYEDIEKML